MARATRQRAAVSDLLTSTPGFRSAQDLHRYLNTVEKPLNQLGDDVLCPGRKALEALNDTLR